MRVLAALTVCTAGLEVVGEAGEAGLPAAVVAGGAGGAGGAGPVVGLTTVAVLVFVLVSVLVMFP